MRPYCAFAYMTCIYLLPGEKTGKPHNKLIDAAASTTVGQRAIYMLCNCDMSFGPPEGRPMTLDLTFASHYIKERAQRELYSAGLHAIPTRLPAPYNRCYASNKRTIPAEAGGSIITLPMAPGHRRGANCT